MKKWKYRVDSILGEIRFLKFERIYNAIIQIIFYHAIVFFLKRNFIFVTKY